MSKRKLRVSIVLTNILLMVFILWRVGAMAAEGLPSPDPDPGAPPSCTVYTNPGVPILCSVTAINPNFYCCNTPATGFCCQYMCWTINTVPLFGYPPCPASILQHTGPNGPYNTTCGANGQCVGVAPAPPAPPASAE